MKIINNKRIIVLGKGFLGKEFERQGFEVWGRDQFNINGNEECGFIYNYLSKLDNFDIIINCIAKSNTRWCEDRANFPIAMFTNGLLPRWFSEYCDDTGKKFVHISTGCLYDQVYKLQKETDSIVAHCNYTVTKWVGEQGCNPIRDLIVRPRLFFGDMKDKNNLLVKLPKYENHTCVRNSLSCVSDVVGAIIALLTANQTGIFNIANMGTLSIEEIAKLIKLPKKPLVSIKYLQEKQGLYLVNARMDITKLKQFYTMSSIEDAIIKCWKTLDIN